MSLNVYFYCITLTKYTVKVIHRIFLPVDTGKRFVIKIVLDHYFRLSEHKHRVKQVKHELQIMKRHIERSYCENQMTADD